MYEVLKPYGILRNQYDLDGQFTEIGKTLVPAAVHGSDLAISKVATHAICTLQLCFQQSLRPCGAISKRDWCKMVLMNTRTHGILKNFITTLHKPLCIF
jgi:hypothetical protein